MWRRWPLGTSTRRPRSSTISAPRLRASRLRTPMSPRRRGCRATPISGRRRRSAPPRLDEVESEGLQRDTEIGPASRLVPLELPSGERVEYVVTVSDLYSTRAATLEQIRSALIGAGILALGASLVTGIVAARSL